MGGGQPDEGSTPVGLVDLDEPTTAPPAADGCDDAVDPAEVADRLRGQVLRTAERRVVVHHQVQVAGRGSPEDGAELFGSLGGAGRYDDVCASGQVSTHDPLADPACAAGDEDAPVLHGVREPAGAVDFIT